MRQGAGLQRGTEPTSDVRGCDGRRLTTGAPLRRQRLCQRSSPIAPTAPYGRARGRASGGPRPCPCTRPGMPYTSPAARRAASGTASRPAAAVAACPGRTATAVLLHTQILARGSCIQAGACRYVATTRLRHDLALSSKASHWDTKGSVLTGQDRRVLTSALHEVPASPAPPAASPGTCRLTCVRTEAQAMNARSP